MKKGQWIKTPDYTPDIIVRNIKPIDDNVIEVRRYNDANLREIAWMWLIVVCIFWTKDFIEKDIIYRNIRWTVLPINTLLKPQYDEYVLRTKYWNIPENQCYLNSKVFNRKNSKLTKSKAKAFCLAYTYKEEPIKTYEEYKKERLKTIGANYDGIFFIAFPLFLFLLAAAPKWRPLRFDTQRRLVYTWSFGRFYITRYPKQALGSNQVVSNYLSTSMLQPWIRFPEHGGLVFHIPHETRSRKPAKIDVGIFRPACKYQNYVLGKFLNHYLSSTNPAVEFSNYFHKEKFILSDVFNWFYQFSLFPAIGYNEKKTEARIQQWLADNPEAPDNHDNPLFKLMENFANNKPDRFYQ
ncbi:MAG: hypothetical protein CSA44_01065 [Gammaproteobacteria bacterium]|nr:MAG: hypothetical protein CSA44_01065 [Gammaproteobacteria bacterium]